MTSSTRSILAACAVLVACDGNDDARVGSDVSQDVTAEVEVADTTPVQPLDTALPFEVTTENHDLRNGVRARVGHVVDGDTVHVWVGTTAPKEYIIRMLGLSAPECYKDHRQTPDGRRLVCTSDDELYGVASYDALKAMVEDKQITVTCDVGANEWCETDPYDRYLAYLVMADGKDAAVEMARAGAGFAYTVFRSSKRADICRAEFDARDAHRGMWALGTIDFVLDGMNSDTRGWYKSHHDSRCNEAIAGH